MPASLADALFRLRKLSKKPARFIALSPVLMAMQGRTNAVRVVIAVDHSPVFATALPVDAHRDRMFGSAAPR